MTPSSSRVVGIDLGTANSVVASVDDDGAVVIVPNASGGEITPSVVYFEPDGTAVVGEEAVQASAFDPEHGVQLIKRAMGTEFPLLLRGRQHTPESVSALILRQLVTASNGSPAAAAGTVPGAVRAVITVPAYFGLAEREATYQAGRIAGIDVLELLDEPVAAAAHYGLTAAGGDRTVLVYDLGGGTFDTTVLRVCGGAVRVLATDGHSSLGGADVDRRLLDVILERLADRLSGDDLDRVTDDRKMLGELLLDTEAAKKDLSARESRPVTVRTPAGRIPVTITRGDLDAACGDLFDTTAEIIERVLRAARLDGGHGIDDVIMVGGSSRIPMLSRRLAGVLGKTPRLSDPDLAVAKGAALRAHHLAGTSQLTALTAARRHAGVGAERTGQVVPVTPRAVGILVEDSFDASGARSFVERLVIAGTPLPVERVVERFGTILDNQESVRVQVYEQAGAVPSPEEEHNRRVLDGELTGLGSLPAGSLIKITVRITIDGRLSVIAHEPRSGRELRLEAYVEGVVDGAEADRLARLVGLTTVRG